jgi:hypothetical protein
MRQPLTALSYHGAHRMFERANALLGAYWTLHDLRHSAAHRMERRGVASDATFRVWRQDGAVSDGGPSTAGRRSRRQSEAAGQEGRDRTVLRQLPACCIHSGCIRRKHDAAEERKSAATREDAAAGRSSPDPFSMVGKPLPTSSRDPSLPLAVQWILGHAHLTTTQVYLNPSVEEAVAGLRAHHARQAHAAANPVLPAPGYDPRSLDVLFGRRP